MEDIKEKRKILVVDDNEINILYLVSFLECYNYIVDSAQNGSVALNKVLNNDYNIIIMDLQMPDMDGFECTREIRKFEKNSGKHTPIIVLTGYDTDAEKEKIKKIEVEEIMRKPINEKKLIERLNKY